MQVNITKYRDWAVVLVTTEFIVFGDTKGDLHVFPTTDAIPCDPEQHLHVIKEEPFDMNINKEILPCEPPKIDCLTFEKVVIERHGMRFSVDTVFSFLTGKWYRHRVCLLVERNTPMRNRFFMGTFNSIKTFIIGDK